MRRHPHLSNLNILSQVSRVLNIFKCPLYACIQIILTIYQNVTAKMYHPLKHTYANLLTIKNSFVWKKQVDISIIQNLLEKKMRHAKSKVF